ncbi:MAG: LiaI-LiaF-like domain-containing protein [Candidatus Zixiibacteriota bacterium]
MCRSGHSIFGGIVLLVLGVLFLLGNLDIMYFDFWDFIGDWWPVILIVVGLSIIFKRKS